MAKSMAITKCQSMHAVATGDTWWSRRQLSRQGGLVQQQRQRREVAALLPSLDMCCGDGQAVAQLLTFWNT